MTKRIALCVVIVAALAGLVAGLVLPFEMAPASRPATASALATAQAAVRNRDWNRAATAAAEVLKARPRDPAALLIAGEAAARFDRFGEAIRHYDAVPDSAGTNAALARLCSGDLRLKLGRMTEAE